MLHNTKIQIIPPRCPYNDLYQILKLRRTKPGPCYITPDKLNICITHVKGGLNQLFRSLLGVSGTQNISGYRYISANLCVNVYQLKLEYQYNNLSGKITLIQTPCS